LRNIQADGWWASYPKERRASFPSESEVWSRYWKTLCM